MIDPQNGFWVFGYGSLMWNPGFEFSQRVPARLDGFSRSFCMWSIHHRGTVEAPGLVLALDENAGTHCTGLAFFITAEHAVTALANLRDRELVSSAYLEKFVHLTLDDGRSVQSLTYVVDPRHVQYTGAISMETQADVIARAAGGRGPNSEYLFNTATHLAELGMNDPGMNELSNLVRHRISSKN